MQGWGWEGHGPAQSKVARDAQDRQKGFSQSIRNERKRGGNGGPGDKGHRKGRDPARHLCLSPLRSDRPAGIPGPGDPGESPEKARLCLGGGGRAQASLRHAGEPRARPRARTGYARPARAEGAGRRHCQAALERLREAMAVGRRQQMSLLSSQGTTGRRTQGTTGQSACPAPGKGDGAAPGGLHLQADEAGPGAARVDSRGGNHAGSLLRRDERLGRRGAEQWMSPPSASAKAFDSVSRDVLAGELRKRGLGERAARRLEGRRKGRAPRAALGGSKPGRGPAASSVPRGQ